MTDLQVTQQSKNILAPGILLRVEGMAVLILAMFAYGRLEVSWLVFLILFLWPDLAIVVYAVNKDWGTAVYNLLHTYTLPIILLIAAVLFSSTAGIQFAIIWFAHIGMDRLFGYGLKYTSAFKDTHLTRL